MIIIETENIENENHFDGVGIVHLGCLLILLLIFFIAVLINSVI